MAPRLLIYSVLLIQVLISSAQSSLQQYLHVTGVGQHSQSAGLANLPNVGYTRQAAPNGLTAMPNGLTAMPNGLTAMPNGVTAMPNGLASFTSGLAAMPCNGMAGMANNMMSNVPNSGLAALGALASIPGLLQALTSATATPQPATSSTGVPTLKSQPLQPSISAPSIPTCKQNCPPTNTPNGGLDAGVLNNLAIALQLLIVSNILNSNLSENEANPIYELLETAKNIPVSLSQTQAQPEIQSNGYSSLQSNSYPSSSALQSYEEMIKTYTEPSYPPNVNFVGTSGFTDYTVTDPYIKPTARNSFQLMSPYEALGPNSPYSDPILGSPYGSVISSKRDFQSPYIMMDSDPFAMNDLFS